jgi:threonine dehydrogenase-like Zn-dependent dehydrogenase
MKAAYIEAPHQLRVSEVKTPEPKQGEVRCKVMRSGICGTDYSIYSGEFSFVKNGAIKFPMLPGHEWSGVVDKVGEGVSIFKQGDRVVGDTAVSCGVCSKCLMGQYFACAGLRCVGTINTWDGAYAEYMFMPARHLFRLPDEVSFDNGAMVEPAATAMYSVVLGKVKLGDTVLVIGTGPIGIMAAKIAKLSGAAKVIIAGRKDFKIQAALDLGVDVGLNLMNTSLTDGVKREGVDCVIEASGSTELLKESLTLLNPCGTISAVAFYEKLIDGLDIDRFVFGGINLMGSAGSLGMYEPTLKLMSVGMLDFTSLITGYYSLDEVPQAMLDMKTKNDRRIKFMIKMGD